MATGSSCPFPVFAATLVVATIGLTACQAKSVFTPVAPDVLATRLAGAFDSPFIIPYTISAGRTGEISNTTIYVEEEGLYSYAVVLDWTSPSNRVTVAVHRTGGPVSFDNDNSSFDETCSVPQRLTGPPLANTGTLIGAALPRPLCPVVWSNTTNEKPKLLDLTSATSGRYSVVVTNEGPGTESVRLAFFAE
jgi:hypothetical protein